VQTQAKETRIKKKMAMTSDSDNNSHEKKKSVATTHIQTPPRTGKKKKAHQPMQGRSSNRTMGQKTSHANARLK
jgi:hypothetical protein